MADRPILMSGPMVRAVLEGRKTQTRRVLNPQPKRWDLPDAVGFVWGKFTGLFPDDWFGQGVVDHHLPYATGDRLYVREAWNTWGIFDDLPPSRLTGKEGIAYAADMERPREEMCGKFRQGMHMPRWASRITLIVNDVRVERVQDISEADAKAEGTNGGCLKCGEDQPCGCTYPEPCHRESFIFLWNSLNEKRGFGWDVNPWVVAVTFEPINANIDELVPEIAPTEENRLTKLDLVGRR